MATHWGWHLRAWPDSPLKSTPPTAGESPPSVSRMDARTQKAKKSNNKKRKTLTDLRTAEHSSDLCVSLRRPRACLLLCTCEAEGMNPAAARSAAHSVSISQGGTPWTLWEFHCETLLTLVLARHSYSAYGQLKEHFNEKFLEFCGYLGSQLGILLVSLWRSGVTTLFFFFFKPWEHLYRYWFIWAKTSFQHFQHSLLNVHVLLLLIRLISSQ